MFVEEGRLNFLIEVTYPPYEVCDWAVDDRAFAIIVSNEILDKYEIGECRSFQTYIFDGEKYVESNREFLKKVEKNSVEHRVSYATEQPNFGRPLKQWLIDIVVISSAQDLSEYFYI